MVEIILVAAARVFEHLGYRDASTNLIAQRAGVSVGSLYEYFPNKAAVLAALIDQHVAEGRKMLTQLAAIAGDSGSLPPLGVLTRRFVDAMIMLHSIAPRLHRVLFEEMRLHPALRRTVDALEDDLIVATEAILRVHPEVAVADTAAAAQIVVHVIEALTHRMVIHPRPGNAQADQADDITRLVAGFLRGVSST
jgi:AcrR family transcriptional regulator